MPRIPTSGSHPMSCSTERTTTDERISETVIDAVSAATGTDPLDLPRIYHVIDLHSVERLFRHEEWRTSTGGRIEFEYAGCDVYVYPDGRVEAFPSEGGPVVRQACTR